MMVKEEDFISRIKNKENHINYLQQEVKYKKIEAQLESKKIKEKFNTIQRDFELEVCAEIPSAFWERNSFTVSLPYEEGFHESQIPTKAKPVQMNEERFP